MRMCVCVCVCTYVKDVTPEWIKHLHAGLYTRQLVKNAQLKKTWPCSQEQEKKACESLYDKQNVVREKFKNLLETRKHSFWVGSWKIWRGRKFKKRRERTEGKQAPGSGAQGYQWVLKLPPINQDYCKKRKQIRLGPVGPEQGIPWRMFNKRMEQAYPYSTGNGDLLNVS